MNRRTVINIVWFNAIFALLLYWAFNNIVSWDRLEKPYTITGDFEQAAGVRANAEVTYLGVHYGRVSSVERLDDGVRMKMKIDRNKDIPKGTIARVFRKSAIGEPYVDFQPTDDYEEGRYWKAGDHIPKSLTTVPLEFSELLRSASNLISSIDEEAAGSLIHELALALDGRGDELASLTRSFDEITRAFVSRTTQLDRLAENSTRLTHVFADHRLSLSASLESLRDIGQALRDANGDIQTLLDVGPDFLGTTADLVADQKRNLDCLLDDLGTVTATLGGDQPLEDLAVTIQNGPTGFGYVAASVDEEADGPWIRVNLTTPVPPAPDAPVYPTIKSLPVVPTVSGCFSSLTPYAGAPFTPSGTAPTQPTPSGPPLPATGGSAAVGAAVVAMLGALVIWQLRRGMTDVEEVHRRRSPAFILVTSLAVALAVAVAVLAVLVADDEGESSRIEEVRRAAGVFGEALVTYDYHDPDAHRDGVLALSTGSFRDEYENAFDQGLAEVITEVEAVSTGFAKDVYVSELGEADAQAIVVLDVEVTGVAGPRTQRDLYVRLTFVEVGGEWKVDQVTDLNFDPGGATTSTSGAPESTTTSI